MPFTKLSKKNKHMQQKDQEKSRVYKQTFFLAGRSVLWARTESLQLARSKLTHMTMNHANCY